MNPRLKFSFSKSSRLLARREYIEMSSGARKCIGHYTYIEIKTKYDYPAKLGITVTKRFGKAHERNRFKRIVREAFRLSRHQIPSGLLIHIKPLAAAKNASMPDIQKEILKAIELYTIAE